MKQETVNIAPNWEAVVRMTCRILEDPSQSESVKREFREELLRLARAVDAQNTGEQ